MSHSNLITYNSQGVLNWYNKLKVLLPAEKKVFETYSSFLLTANVLDIGIGGGRTTGFLLNRCGNYTGIDYSEGFVKLTQEKYPSADIRKADARDLSEFKNDSFDFVNFSFNGMDYVNYEGREKIFREINRVLKSEGVFFFSTHNKDHERFSQTPWSDASQGFITNLKTFLKLLPFLLRHSHNKKKEIHQERYAIINDSAHNYSLFTFYTSPSFLMEQLHKFNFIDSQLLLKNGVEDQEERPDDWLFVVCKKSAS